jgi:hypothetical protein
MEVAALDVVAKEAVAGVNVMLVAADAVVAKEADPNNDPVNDPVYEPVCSPTNDPVKKPVYEPVNDPVCAPTNEPVKEPVLICAELDTVPATIGAHDADVANEAVAGVNVIELAALAVVANEAVAGVNVMLVAAEAVVAKLLDPNSKPVNEPV